MRHQAAAAANRSTVWEDIGIGAAGFAACLALVVGVALWTGDVTGSIFVIGVAVVAWRSGFAPAVVVAMLGGAAIGPLTATLDARADAINIPARVITVWVGSLVVGWLCDYLLRSRERMVVAEARLSENENVQGALASERQRLLVDIGKLQEVEGQLRHARDEADRRANEAEEARAALKDRERRLHEEARLKDEFLATLAHELRNPLAPLRNVSEILRREPLSDTARHATGVMDRQIAQLVRLIDDLIDVSRVSRGHLTLQRQSVDLRTIIESAIETAQPQLAAAGVSLTTEIPPQACLLDVDATRIGQILLNLLTNAAKFTPAGGRVWLTVTRHIDRVSIVVRDTGIGIAIEDQARVFDIFAQLNRDMRSSQTGLGIGLTLVKQMAELHGGNVTVWSDGVGQGSEFTVTLPISSVAAHTKPADLPAPAARVSRKMLLADDNTDGADSLAFLLRAAGHAVTTAYDGRTAIRLAEELRPEVVLLDLGMPEVSGYDVARAIRRETWGRTMRLIALTGWGQAEHRRRSIEAGFDHHLVKPVELDVLEDVLQMSTPALNSGKSLPIS